MPRGAFGRASVAVVVLVSACGSDSNGVGLGTAGCLSDQQICQFKKGVSTETDVKNALGNAQEFLGANTWVYLCMQITGTQIVHNDEAIFDFDDTQHLSDVTVLRLGTGSTPPPNCDAMGSPPPSSTGACANIPVPPETVPCQTAVFGVGAGAPEMTTCTDQNGNRWTATCSGSSCGCSYNDTTSCMCTLSGSGVCCPGVY